jgi:hypothetical protein
LTIAGLPKYGPGYLSFAEDSDDKDYGVVKLTEQYDFFGEEANYDKYIVIGSCRDGDAIAIDTSDEDTIWELDHEDSFNAQFFNSSIESLAHFLIIYQQFEALVVAENGLDRFKSRNFTDMHFDQLRNKMLEIDERALTERGFWKEQLEIILALRQEFLDHGPGIDPFADLILIRHHETRFLTEYRSHQKLTNASHFQRAYRNFLEITTYPTG